MIITLYSIVFLGVFFLVAGISNLILKINKLKENEYRNAGNDAGIFYQLQKRFIYRPFLLRLASLNSILGESQINHWYKKKLMTSGNPWRLIPVEFFAYKELLAVLLGVTLSTLYYYSMNEIKLYMILLFVFAGFRAPNFWLEYKIKQRKSSILIDLPFFIDIIALASAAGLDFKTAIERVVKEGHSGYLRSEFDKLLQDLRVSPILSSALNNLAERIDLYEIRSFVLALIQADKQGSPIKDALRIQSEIRLEERFLRAEKLANEAPTKINFPLILCILPPAVLMIGVPLYLQFSETGIF